ncbi:MAG: hypothetical protein HGA38_00765 [Candidatus Moranbacteria bacterium]|nr:hypothetical protein [Candidatus Moranbacteria bacterium]NTW45544.1 hypothetical protein [Candidatus Moranbacteria bacterium]
MATLPVFLYNTLMDYLLFVITTLSIPAAGYALLRGIFGRSDGSSPLERLVFSFALGIGSLDVSMMFLSRISVPTNASTMIAAMASLPVAVLLTRLAYERILHTGNARKDPRATMPSFRGRESALFALLLALTVFLKTFFLVSAGLPTATDLGHHMYWSKVIAETGELPRYEKITIEDAGEGRTKLTDPQPISDFIIGEHLPFAAIAILSGASFLSAFPVSFLLLVNLLSVCAVFLVATRFAEHLSLPERFSPARIGLGALLFAGPLFSIASPEAKFVSGGVVGNLFGDFLIPLALLAFLRAFAESSPRLLGLGILLSFTLAYTHHLSVLILAISLAITLLLLITTRRRKIRDLGRRMFRLLLSPFAILTIVFAGLFFLFVMKPTYIENNAVTTAIGTATKATRTGLTFAEASGSTGASRMAIGLAALLAIVASTGSRKSDAFAFLAGWAGALLIATLHPGWMKLDIPSDRVGNYLSFPFSVLAGTALAGFPAILRSDRLRTFLPGQLFLFASLVLFSFAAWEGLQDNQASLPTSAKAQDTLETFASAEYLAARSLPSDVFLKDHNYITADSWMKIFFMRDYAYPLSRAYFKRYEDEAKPREQCTLRMVSTPNLPEGRACFEDLGVNLVAVNPAYDAEQFERSSDFSRIYSSTAVQVYERIR